MQFNVFSPFLDVTTWKLEKDLDGWYNKYSNVSNLILYYQYLLPSSFFSFLDLGGRQRLETVPSICRG